MSQIRNSLHGVSIGVLMTVLSGGLGSTSVWAEAADANATAASPAGASDLQEIVVTARRVEENQQRVPVAVTTLSGDALGQRNIEQVSDLQFSVPNLQIKQSNTYSSVPEFILRGQRQTLYTDENVVTYVNGVPQGTRGLTLYDLDSVQVLKGPQGTLFGKNSNGGAVIVTTKKPGSELDARIDVDLGNYSLARATGMVNLPLARDKALLRISGQIERRDGVYTNSYPGARDPDNRHNASGRIALLLRPFDSLESLTTIDGVRRNETGNPTVVEAAPTTNTGFGALLASLTQQSVIQQSALGGATPINQDGNLVRQGNPFNVRVPTGIGKRVPGGSYDPIATFGVAVDDYGVANTTSYELNERITVRNILGYRYERAIDQEDSSSAAGFTLDIAPFLGALGVPGLPSTVPGQLVNNNVNFLNQFNTLTEELQLLGSLQHDRFIGGLFYSHVDHRYTVSSSFTAGPVDLYGIGPRYGSDDITTKSRAVFGQVTHDFGALGLDALSLTAGVRYTWDQKDFSATNFFTNGNQADFLRFDPATDVCAELNGAGRTGTGVNDGKQCALYGGRTYKAPTWTVSLDYRIDPDTMVYFTNRRGFKAGSSSSSTVNQDLAMFGSEYLTDFEVGLKTQGHLASMPYRLNVDAFLGHYRDIQTADILTFCASAACTGTYTDLVVVNSGRATIKGVELEATLKPLRTLQVDVGYSYQQARYGAGSVIPQPLNPGPVGPTNPINFTGGVNLAGQDIPGIPQHNVTVAASYTLDFVPSDFAITVLSANYAYRSDTNGNGPIGVYKTPGYGLGNARLSFESLGGSPVSLAFWVSNITDKVYPLACADNLSSIAYATCYWGEPRTFGATITARLR